jgi:protein SCO1/2
MRRRNTMAQNLIVRTFLFLVACGIVAGGVIGGLYFYGNHEPPVAVAQPVTHDLAEPGSVPIGGPFALTDQTGKPVTDEDYRGKYLLVFFGYTYCPDVCPTTLNDLAETMDLLGDRARTVQPLFISVDPERDTPDVLAKYVAAFGHRIVGLTGTKKEIADVARAYHVFFQKISVEDYYGESLDRKSAAKAEKDGEAKPKDYFYNHSANVYLMSPNGDYLTHFDYGTKPKDMASTVLAAIDKFGFTKPLN